MRRAGSSGGGARASKAAERMRWMHARHARPDNEVPGALGFHAVLGRTEDLAVSVIGARVYSTGIELEVGARLRRRDPGSERHQFGQEAQGARHFGDPNRALLLGVIYPDGRWATNAHPHRDAFRDDETPSMLPGSGGGSDVSHNATYWISPLPPPGDLTLVCAWPSRGVAETRTVIAADALAGALSRVVELWPWEPPADEPDPPRTPLALPAGSWFAEVLGPKGDHKS